MNVASHFVPRLQGVDSGLNGNTGEARGKMSTHPVVLRNRDEWNRPVRTPRTGLHDFKMSSLA
jgi:hypothetical protein